MKGGNAILQWAPFNELSPPFNNGILSVTNLRVMYSYFPPPQPLEIYLVKWWWLVGGRFLNWNSYSTFQLAGTLLLQCSYWLTQWCKTCSYWLSVAFIRTACSTAALLLVNSTLQHVLLLALRSFYPSSLLNCSAPIAWLTQRCNTCSYWFSVACIRAACSTAVFLLAVSTL